MRKALINSANIIVNIIEADNTYVPPFNFTVVNAELTWTIGGMWDGTTYTLSPKQTEQARQSGLPIEDRIDEDILKPFMESVNSPVGHMIKALFETLLNAINVEREARGAPVITKKAAVDLVKTKLIKTYKG